MKAIPAQGQNLKLDGKLYKVEKCVDNMGLLTVDLAVYRTWEAAKMIEIDPSALTKAEAMLKDIPGAAQKAAKTAIKKTMKGAQQAAIKKVRERYTIKPAYIKADNNHNQR